MNVISCYSLSQQSYIFHVVNTQRVQGHITQTLPKICEQPAARHYQVSLTAACMSKHPEQVTGITNNNVNGVSQTLISAHERSRLTLPLRQFFDLISTI